MGGGSSTADVYARMTAHGARRERRCGTCPRRFLVRFQSHAKRLVIAMTVVAALLSFHLAWRYPWEKAPDTQDARLRR